MLLQSREEMPPFSKHDEYKILQLIKQEAPVVVRKVAKIRKINNSDAYNNLYDSIRFDEFDMFKTVMQTQQTASMLPIVYDELNIRRIPLSFKIKVRVEKELIKHRLFTKKTEGTLLITPSERIEFIYQLVKELKQQSGC